MPESSDGSISQFFEGMRTGDDAAARRLWERFFPRLYALSRKVLAGRAQRAADAEDVVLSAFASFYRRAREGGFGQGLDRDNLWSLLGVIAVRKARRQARREDAQKRGGGHVLDEAAHGGLDFLAARPAADFDTYCEELLAQLRDEELRTIAVLRLLGHKNREIAEQLGCTERKIERKLNLIRLTWEQHDEE